MTIRLVVIGVVSLAIAMGIGRFAFTPLLPLMMRDGTLNGSSGAEWAAANYAGYLLGALTAARFAGHPRAGLLLALLGVSSTTLASAWVGADSARTAGAALRLLAGVFSAWTLVCASTWCLAALARRAAASLGAWIYCGVGLGIALAGLLAWLGGRQSASALWTELGVLASVGTLFVALALRGGDADGPRSGPATAGSAAGPSGTSNANPAAASATSSASRPSAPEARAPAPASHRGLVFCYGAFGFGYIVQATFLPAMAREQVSDPLVFGLTWPLFGAAAALSVMAAARYLPAWPRHRVWTLAQAVMALGTALPLVSQALWALSASAVLVGGTFMVATMAGLQLAREHVPQNPMPLLARMTVAFATGQIAGPLLIRGLAAWGWVGFDAIALSNALATVLLCATAWWLWRSAR